MLVALDLFVGSFESQITTLVVGVEEREYRVHQDVLSSNFPYFVAAVKEEGEKGQKPQKSLLHDIAVAVDMYIKWIYNKRIFSRQPLDAMKEGQQELGVLIGWLYLGR